MDDIDGSVGPGDGEIFVDFCSTESEASSFYMSKKTPPKTKQKNGPHKKGGPRTQQGKDFVSFELPTADFFRGHVRKFTGVVFRRIASLLGCTYII